MIPCIPCETARELLEPFLDRELSTNEQVAVEAHLRWCRTCAAHIDDLALIGWSLRAGTPATSPVAEDSRALAIVQSDVLARVKAEQAESWRAWFVDLFADMRLWWPAMGATAAVIICLCGSINIWRLTTLKQPNSLAWTIDTLATPGSDRNPLPLNDGMLVPRVLDEGFVPESIFADDATFAIAAVFTTTGQVGKAELLRERQVVWPVSLAAAQASDNRAVLNAVRGSRWTPAQAGDEPVAVTTVFLFERITIREPLRPLGDEIQIQQRARRSSSKTLSQPSSGRSASEQASPTA
ncbi:MAG TPA: zf-HC2 domain-containing protein [Vicinamibacterales bacterium]|nr:zf-HC2 domain-containing protein [Vicinamibacterales bacterium]